MVSECAVAEKVSGGGNWPCDHENCRCKSQGSNAEKGRLGGGGTENTLGVILKWGEEI